MVRSLLSATALSITYLANDFDYTWADARKVVGIGLPITY